MKIRMLKTTSGSYDGVNTKEYIVGSEYAVGRDLISVDLAKVFIDSAVAVEIQEPDGVAEGEAIPGDNLAAPKNADGSEQASDTSGYPDEAQHSAPNATSSVENTPASEYPQGTGPSSEYPANDASGYPAADPYGTEKAAGPTGPSETKKKS